MVLYWPWYVIDGDRNGYTNTTDSEVVIVLPPTGAES